MSMTKDSVAQEISRLLANREERLVLAESCTGGMVAATLAQIPGISNHLCGSFVTYRPASKRRWLGVRKHTIKDHTTESKAVAGEMAVRALRQASEADWSAAVVGHFGPDAPEDKDGQIFVAIARRTRKGNIKVKDEIEYVCQSDTRLQRQNEATEVTLTHVARALHKKTERDGKAKDVPQKKKKDKEVKREGKRSRKEVVGAS